MAVIFVTFLGYGLVRFYYELELLIKDPWLFGGMIYMPFSYFTIKYLQAPQYMMIHKESCCQSKQLGLPLLSRSNQHQELISRSVRELVVDDLCTTFCQQLTINFP